MKKNSLSLFTLLCAIGLLFACRSSVPIQKGKLIGNTTIQFKDKNIILKPNEFFKLEELGIKASTLKKSNKVLLTDLESALKRFKRNKVKNYDIIINNSNYQRPFYGKIAFFNAPKSHALNAVARYYEVSIGSSYFENATRGRMAIVYEYFENKIGGIFKTTVKTPTWVIILSDEPF